MSRFFKKRLNWKDIRFSRSVDQDYLKQIISYSEEAQHDDAPDSLSGLVSALKPGRQSLNARLDGFGARQFGIFGR